MCKEASMLMATRYDDHRNSHYNRHNNYYGSQGRGISGDQRKEKHLYHNNFLQSKRARLKDNSGDYRQRDSHRESKKQETKPKLQACGDWSEYKSSSGKIYYYNSVTEVSQWEKPADWVQYEKKRGSEKARRRNHHYSGSHDSGSHHSSSANLPSSSGASHPNNQEDKASSSPQSRDSPSPSHSPKKRWDISNSLSAPCERAGKRQRTESPTGEETEPWKRVLSQSAWDEEPESFSSCVAKERSVSAQLDLSKLPQLLVELAEKYKIDLHEERAVDKLKSYLKKAVKPGTSSAPVSGEGNRKGRESEDVSGRESEGVDDGEPMDESLRDEAMDTSPSCSASLPEEKKEEEEEQRKGRSEEKDSAPQLSSSLEGFCREDLARHANGWSAEYFEAQSWVWAGSLLNGSVQLGQIMADMKCARSLVRTAEIRSTLINQRVMVVRQQIKQFDPQTRPSGGGAGSSASGGSS